MQDQLKTGYTQLAMALTDTASADHYYEILIGMKDNGLKKEQAYEMLVTLRSNAQHTSNEQQEDQILELMDIVTGYCPPHKRIWD